jgi:ubiquinone/menaquinone biosynthesis C-methylase UbiE
MATGRILEPEAMDSLEAAYTYDHLTRKYLQILHAGFVETALNFCPEAGRVLEVGTGTGRILIEMAKYNPRLSLVGLELSANMLAVARENARREGVADRIAFLLADAKQMPFPSASFDAVLCHNMLHHLPDPLLLIAEVARIARPDAAILIRDLIRPPRLLIPLHVHILGLPYNQAMKAQYRDSLRAALSKAEWRELFARADIHASRLTRQFVTHITLQRKSARPRSSRVSLPAPLLLAVAKRFYIGQS